VKTRQFVWTRPELLAEVRQNFIAVAASDVDYVEHPDKERWEYRLLASAFRDQPHGIHQGIYAITPSGEMLGKINHGWPDPDPEAALEALHRALRDYRRMPRAGRLLDSLPEAAAARLSWEHDQFTMPPGTLDLRVVKRSYPFEGMTSFDIRHPMYYSLDRLWYRPDEFREWVPERRVVGATREVKGPALRRLIFLNHLMRDDSPWDEEHVKHASMTSRITRIEGPRITIEIEAAFDLQASGPWNQGTYRGTLLGSGDFDAGRSTFTRLEMLALGTHTVGKLLPNMHSGHPISRMGALITLDPQEGSARMRPTQWKWGYTLAWCR
jgi:hypothetical protein